MDSKENPSEINNINDNRKKFQATTSHSLPLMVSRYCLRLYKFLEVSVITTSQ